MLCPARTDRQTELYIKTHRGEKHGKEVYGGLDVVTSVNATRWWGWRRKLLRVKGAEPQPSAESTTAQSLRPYSPHPCQPPTATVSKLISLIMNDLWPVVCFFYLLCTHMRHRGKLYVRRQSALSIRSTVINARTHTHRCTHYRGCVPAVDTERTNTGA